ncbi:hypothetical protein OTERR_30550 [Oryzomicrobium terrae]|uniref:Uncharacterized protein n=1 Tax=Oryzomicrobium terrae TaxID=1735038 RepID=A0A5C1EC35_9RHOO|nr:hypothetical protein [Oryzomicrobium terrae]QEL66531.1 hypothetical protein OTERR_30550 [Oryzomicrobium terrae]
METFFRIDWSAVTPEVVKGLSEGTMRMSSANGVAYWARGSGNTGAVQHLPFIPANMPDAGNLMDAAKIIQAAQQAQLVALGISTGVIVGAIVIQTMYLARKLDKLQKTIDLVSEEIHAQNIVFYMNKVADYFGSVESARIFMLDRSLKDEVKDIAVPVLADLAIRRNQLFSFIENILELAKTDTLSQRHYELIVDFVSMALDMLPKGAFVEKELYAFIEKYGLSDLLIEHAGNRYVGLMATYKGWCNDQVKLAVKGNKLSGSILSRDRELKSLFSSGENKLLISGV